jgi:23S rRNA (guanosine2251-2'-O)-methyltransferase
VKKKSAVHITTTVIFGCHPVQETLRAGRRVIEHIFVSRGSSLPRGFREEMEGAGIPVTAVTPDDMLARTGSPHHQGVAAVVGPFPYLELEDFLASHADAPGPVLILDEVQDPANLGNILRSAECLGAASVILTKDRSAPVSAVAEKASAGASAHMPVAKVVNLVRAIELLKQAGYWIYGTAADADRTIYSLDFAGKTAFVLGSEGKGMRRLVREACDGLVAIPMAGRTSSLNVSQAATVVLAEALRRRLAAPRS